MSEIARWRPQKGTRVKGSEAFGCSAIAVPSMGHMGITGTLGVKEAGCGLRIGHPIGGMVQRDVTVELSLSAFQINMSNFRSKTCPYAPGAKPSTPRYPSNQYVTQDRRVAGAAIADDSTWRAAGYIFSEKPVREL
jgi:hypothetical protein